MKIIEKKSDQPKILDEFLEIPPFLPDAKERAKAQVQEFSFDRRGLFEILKRYNESIGNDAQALVNLDRLKNDDSFFVVTGQQLGFMGGPAYTILKILTALSLAEETGAIPLFWAATEDHDVDEINHTYLLDEKGNLDKYQLEFPKDGRFVEELSLNDQHKKVIEKFNEMVKFHDLEKELADCRSYTQYMMRVLVVLFKGTGLLYIEPKILREKAASFFKKEIVDADEIAKILQDTTERLKKASGTAPIEIKKGTNLFLKTDGIYRKKIERVENHFAAGGETYSQEELLNLVDKEPERFSTNVCARPVLQALILPTLAYVAGPGELAYHEQLKTYFHFHKVKMPWIIPRLSMTFIPPPAAAYFKKMQLNPWDEIPGNWKGVESKGSLSIQDHKVTKEKLKQKDIPSHALHFVRNLVLPQGKPQERVFNFFEFQKQTEKKLIVELLEKVDWRCRGHLYCFYE